MIYECEHCGYSTFKNSNFLRHKNRKNSCMKMTNGNNNISNSNISGNMNMSINLKENTENNNCVLFCVKCKKVLLSKKNLKNHEKICRGVPSKTCSICLKVFNTDQAKYYHKRFVKCQPPPQQVIPQTINNINTTNNNNNTTNNITNNNTINNNNNNIQINVFGKEDLSYLLNDKNILQKLKSFGKSGIYGLPKIINDVHFNKDKPENSTLIKPDEYGNGVMILNDEKEWEYREFEDIRDDLISTIIKYFKAYNTVKNKLGVKLIEKKERNIIKNIAYELMSLEGTIPLDLFEELEMNEDVVEEDEDEIKHKIRKFDKSTMKNIHHKTSINYKKDNGSYIKK